MFVTLINKSGQDLDDLTATLQTSDPKIECISGTTVAFTSAGNPLLDKASRESLTPFVFRVEGDANRAVVNERFFATFQLNVRSDRFDVGSRVIPITLELDLNASGGGAVIGYTESFESASADELPFVHLDRRESRRRQGFSWLSPTVTAASTTTRPDRTRTTPGRASCFLGFVNAGGQRLRLAHSQRRARGQQRRPRLRRYPVAALGRAPEYRREARHDPLLAARRSAQHSTRSAFR